MACLLNSYLFAQPAGRSDPKYHLETTVTVPVVAQEWVFSGTTPTRFHLQSRDKRLLRTVSGGDFDDVPLENTGDLIAVTASRAAGYFAVIGLKSEDKETKVLLITIFTEHNQRLYQLRWPRHFDASYPLLRVSDQDGSLVVGDAATGRVLFYDNGGRLTQTHVLFPGATYGLERVMAMDMSLRGDLVVVAGKRGASPLGSSALQPSAEPEVIMYAPGGTKRWRKKLTETNVADVAISADGHFLAASAYSVGSRGNVRKSTLLLTEEEREIAAIDLLPKQMQFSSDSKFLILAENQRAGLIATASGKMLWSKRVSRSDGMIAALALPDGAEVTTLLLARNEFRGDHFGFVRGRLRFLDLNGRRAQEDIILNTEAVVMPALTLTPDAGKLVVGFEKSYQIYTREQ